MVVESSDDLKADALQMKDDGEVYRRPVEAANDFEADLQYRVSSSAALFVLSYPC